MKGLTLLSSKNKLRSLISSCASRIDLREGMTSSSIISGNGLTGAFAGGFGFAGAVLSLAAAAAGPPSFSSFFSAAAAGPPSFSSFFSAAAAGPPSFSSFFSAANHTVGVDIKLRNQSRTKLT